MVEVARVAADARPSFWLDFHLRSVPGFNDISILARLSRFEI
jgi:hypothetical protein